MGRLLALPVAEKTMLKSNFSSCAVLSLTLALAACAEGTQIRDGGGGSGTDGRGSGGAGTVGGGTIGGGHVGGSATGGGAVGGGPAGGSAVGGGAGGVPVDATAFPSGDSAWVGAYTCEQGLTNLHLSLTRDAVTNDMTAVFAFSPHPSNPDVDTGSFSLVGDYDPVLDELLLTPDAWIDQPGGWTMVGISGIFEESLNSIQLTFLENGQPMAVCQPALVTPAP